jgi:hypothetical protein
MIDPSEVRPGGIPSPGDAAERSRRVPASDVDWSARAPIRPGNAITGRVEFLDVLADTPINRLRTEVVRTDGAFAVEGSPFGSTMPSSQPAPT